MAAYLPSRRGTERHSQPPAQLAGECADGGRGVVDARPLALAPRLVATPSHAGLARRQSTLRSPLPSGLRPEVAQITPGAPDHHAERLERDAMQEVPQGLPA